MLRAILPPETPVVFARAVSRPDERIEMVRLDAADAARADMRTLVLIGSAAMRCIERPEGAPWLYAPRSAEAPT